MYPDFELGAWPGLLPLAVVAFVWARVLARQITSHRRLLRGIRITAIVAPVASLSATLFFLLRAFVSVKGATADTRVSAMATKISHAMAFTAAGYVVVLLLLVTLVVLTIRMRSTKRQSPD